MKFFRTSYKSLLILSLSLHAAVFAQTPEAFYTLPIPSDAKHIVINDKPFAKLATMRFATQSSPKTIIAFYQERIKAPMSERKFKNTQIFTFERNQQDMMISVTNYMGLADVVLQVQKEVAPKASDAPRMRVIAE